jgi:hypothetical protein
MPRTIEQQIKATYFALRVGAAVIAFVFPLLLWGGGKVGGFSLRDSMSAYYWTTPVQLCPCGENPDHSCQKKGSEVNLTLSPSAPEKTIEPGTMRSWFVGLLFAIGTLLYVNQGHRFNFITSPRSPVYWAELFGIYAFAGYWCVKTKEMSGPDIKRIIAEKHEQAVI